MEEKVFAEGIYLNRVNEKAPVFIKANVSIHIEKAIEWLKKQTPNEEGYITLIGKESKTLDAKGLPKRYFELDTWKPEPKQNDLPTKEDDTALNKAYDELGAPDVDENGIPF